MTIDEAIEKYRIRVKQYKDWDNMKDITEEHEQLAEWLEDYKRVKKWKNEVMEEFCRCDASSVEELMQRARNKAIDDFAEELKSTLPIAVHKDCSEIDYAVDYELYNMRFKIDKVAQQLKDGGTDG